MNAELQKRKRARLPYYDYSASSYYFITICTASHRNLFGSILLTPENGKMLLNQHGIVLDRHIRSLNNRYSRVSVANYVIMPNHLHLLLLLDNGNDVSLSQIIGLFKSGVSRELGFPAWQRSFHDHIVRSEKDYKKIWEYIDRNPASWAMDRYYHYDD